MLPELTGQHLTCNPLKTAVIDGHERWSYVEYDHYVQSIANHLISLGYNGRHKIAIIAKNSAGLFHIKHLPLPTASPNLYEPHALE